MHAGSHPGPVCPNAIFGCAWLTASASGSRDRTWQFHLAMEVVVPQNLFKPRLRYLIQTKEARHLLESNRGQWGSPNGKHDTRILSIAAELRRRSIHESRLAAREAAHAGEKTAAVLAITLGAEGM